MRKLTFIAPLSAMALAACGNPEPAENNLASDNLTLNAMVANEVAVANDVANVPEAAAKVPATPAPAPAPRLARKPAPEPPAPKPPEPKPAPDPACAPEHRAAGHC